MSETAKSSESPSQPAVRDTPAAGALPWWQRLLRHLLALILLAGLWLGMFWMFSRDCDQPLAWHPDEAGKVRQVLSDGEERNWNHPQLLLEGTVWWTKYFEVVRDFPSTAAAGRQVSAACGATTVTFFAAAGYLAWGFSGLLLAAVATGLCAPLMSASHYMKEDAGLAMGVAATVLASRWIWNTKRWWSRIPAWIGLGAAVALAASGKYVGAGAAVVAILCVLFAPAWRWWTLLPRLLIVLAAMVAGWLVINHLALNDPMPTWQQVREDWRQPLPAVDRLCLVRDRVFRQEFLRGFEGEKEHSITQHRGVTTNIPNPFVYRITLLESRWHIIGFACLLPLLMVVTWRRGWGWETLIILFAASFTLILSFTVILFARYALPTALLLHFLAAIAAARLVRLLDGRKWLQGILLVALLNLFLLLQLPRWMGYAQQFSFAADSRDLAKAWLVNNLPAGAYVYADDYTSLEYGGRALSSLRQHRPDVRLSVDFMASRFGTVESLAARDAWVVIASTQFDRYFEPLNRPTEGHRYDFERAQAFYKTLLETQTPVWKKVEKYPQRAFTSPDIYIYHLVSE